MIDKMAILGAGAMTLADWAKRMDPNGKVDKIVEILSQQNEVLDDMLWVQGNLPTGHKTTVRTGLPTVAWRMLNYGVKPGKSHTKQITDTCGMLESYCEIDKKLADLNGNSSAFLLSESWAYLEAMNQEMAKTMFYGDTNLFPAKYIGLTPRYSRLTREVADQEDSSDYVINAGGTGSKCTSLWVVVWGDIGVHGIFPKGSKAGLQQENKGQVTLEDPDGGRYEGYRVHFSWDCGLTVRDYRQVVRIANIDTSKLNDMDLVGNLVEALEKVQNLKAGKPVIYGNKTVLTALRQQIRKSNNVHLSLDEVGGKRVLTFDGLPVRRVDAIHNQEAAVA